MSGCKGCGQVSTMVDPFSEFSGNSGQTELESWWTDTGDERLTGAEAFLAMTTDKGSATVQDEASAELAAVEQEDEMTALQELSEVEQEGQDLGVAEVSLDALLTTIKARPGLKITFSY